MYIKTTRAYEFVKMDIWCSILVAYTGVTLLSLCFFYINVWQESVPLIRLWLLMALRVSVDTLAYFAVTSNSPKVILYLRELYSNNPAFTYTAALHGNIDCLRYMHELGYVWANLTCAAAFVNGNIECLQYAHQHGAMLNLEKADQVQNADCMFYLILHGATFTEKALIKACARKDLQMFDLLLSTWGYRLDFFKVCMIAQLGFHKAIDRPCKQHDFEGMKTVMVVAANYGHVEFLRVLHEKWCWPLPSTCEVQFQSTVSARIRDQILSYLHTHTYVEAECIECGITTLLDAPLHHKAVQQHPRWRKYVRAGRKILDAMERAYLDPRHKWCRRRLLRDYTELMAITLDG